MKDNYFYKNTNKVNGFSKDEYIKFLEAQVIILRDDNKRLIKKLEGKTNEFNTSNDIWICNEADL